MPFPKIEISVKFKNNKGPRPEITCTMEAAEVLKEVMDGNTMLWVEELVMLCMDCHNKLIGWYPVSKGGHNQSIVDVGVIATVAALSAARRVILAHNHPSGELHASIGDRQATEIVRAGLKTIGVELVDHFIVTSQGIRSVGGKYY